MRRGKVVRRCREARLKRSVKVGRGCELLVLYGILGIR